MDKTLLLPELNTILDKLRPEGATDDQWKFFKNIFIQKHGEYFFDKLAGLYEAGMSSGEFYQNMESLLKPFKDQFQQVYNSFMRGPDLKI